LFFPSFFYQTHTQMLFGSHKKDASIQSYCSFFCLKRLGKTINPYGEYFCFSKKTLASFLSRKGSRKNLLAPYIGFNPPSLFIFEKTCSSLFPVFCLSRVQRQKTKAPSSHPNITSIQGISPSQRRTSPLVLSR